VSENRARYPIAVMCRVLDVSASGYYAWVKRPPSMRAVTDAALTAKIHAAHVASNGTYGAPRLQIDLAEAGIRVGRKRVARLMRNAGFVGAFTWVSITYHIRASLCGGDSRARSTSACRRAHACQGAAWKHCGKPRRWRTGRP
jgi:transposase InsO family protein